jgi:hypothetical protein
VLYQLSYAPRLRGGLYRRPARTTSAWSNPAATTRRHPVRPRTLLREQEGTGYGEDEGEREQALDELDDE